MAVLFIAYIFWVIFLRTIIRLFKKCCAKAAKFAEQNYEFENDLYNTISYR